MNILYLPIISTLWDQYYCFHFKSKNTETQYDFQEATKLKLPKLYITQLRFNDAGIFQQHIQGLGFNLLCAPGYLSLLSSPWHWPSSRQRGRVTKSILS